MTPDEYLHLSARTTNPNLELMVERLGDPKVQELHQAIMGMVKEAGELQDAMYRWLIYGKPLDFINIKEELGDSQWYHALAMRAVGTTYESLWQHNIDKLRVRYAEKFTEDEALNRRLDTERVSLESGD